MRLALFLYFTLYFFDKAPGQNGEPEPYTMPNTEVRYLHSVTNDVEYKICVSYPINYKDSTNKRYGVLYLLDADYSFAIAKNVVDHLSQRNHLKEIIVIGIAYGGPNQYRMHRTRDYTPVRSDEDVPFKEIQSTYSGGGPAFLDFLEKELFPYVSRNYRTNNYKVISGHSYGGLFASWTLLTKPDLFDAYLIVSPSLWYSNHFIFVMDEKLTAYRGSTLKVYFCVGERENSIMPEDLNRFIKYLDEKHLKTLAMRNDLGINETHNSIFPYALSNGLRYIFDGF